MRWWQGYMPEEIGRVACFAVPGAIIVLMVVAHLTGGY